MTDRSLDRQMRRVEELVEALEQRSDPVARASARELMQTLLELHREGLARLMEVVRQSGNGPSIAEALAQDQVIGSLLLLHGLHPVDLQTRAQSALEQVRPMVRGHGGELEIVVIAGRVVRVRLTGPCSLPLEALEHHLEEAFASAAPEVQVIEVEDPSRGAETRLPLPILSGDAWR